MKFALLALCALTLLSNTARAQQPSPQAAQFAGQVATACLGQWDNQQCLATVSQSSLALIATYGETLQQNGHAGQVESLKNHCAATTAASQQQVPAYAMKSALTECANTMTSLAAQTGIQPDPSHFQLLVAPVICLDNDPRCASVEEGLKRFQ